MTTVITWQAPGNAGNPAPATPAVEFSPDLAAPVRPGPEAAAGGFARYLDWLAAENPDYAADRAAMTGADLAADTRFRWRQYAFRRSAIYDHAHELRGDLQYLIQQIEAFTEPYDGTEFAAALHAAGVPSVTPGDEADARTMFGYMHRAAIACANRLRVMVNRFDEVSQPPYEDPAPPRPPILSEGEAADSAAVYAFLLNAADQIEAFGPWCREFETRRPRVELSLVPGTPYRHDPLDFADTVPGDVAGLPWALRTAAAEVYKAVCCPLMSKATRPELDAWKRAAGRRLEAPVFRFDPAAAEADPRAAWVDLFVMMDHLRDAATEAQARHGAGRLFGGWRPRSPGWRGRSRWRRTAGSGTSATTSGGPPGTG